MDVLDLIVRFEVRVNECHFGAFGFFNTPADYLDCFWKTYAPVLPIWSYSVADKGDMKFDYAEWRCNSLSDQDWDIYFDEDGNEMVVIEGEEQDVEDVEEHDGENLPPEVSNI